MKSEVDTAIESATQQPKQRRSRKALWLGLFAVLAVVGGRWVWQQMQFTRLRVPLIEAVKTDDTSLVRELLAQGADPNVRIDYQAKPFTWLSLIQILRGVKTAMKATNETVLSYAAGNDETEIVRLLLENGADAKLTDPESRGSSLHRASMGGSTESIEMLVAQGANVNGKTDLGETPIYGAITEYAIRDDNEEGPIEESAIECLLKHGANVNVQNSRGMTPLMWAAIKNEEPEAATVISRLLKQGADVQPQDEEGESALIDAAQYGKPESVRILLQHGAKADMQDQEGMTALIHAVDRAKEADIPSNGTPHGRRAEYLATIRFLIDSGADIRLKDKSGKTAMQIAHSWGDTQVEALLRKAAARSPEAGKGAGN